MSEQLQKHVCYHLKIESRHQNAGIHYDVNNCSRQALLEKMFTSKSWWKTTFVPMSQNYTPIGEFHFLIIFVLNSS